ncbi:hypothetical protein P4O66_012348 [Electrophorus voltai]|uniref:Cilia- and flagella-associated protein 299 n=1 Tax=Electrophorus voltai TaxID=2609070 RepID=A0AAD8Z6R7_9TELE|nr:hypothetical protein P4O66_012348 [Electrophorus voltai]
MEEDQAAAAFDSSVTDFHTYEDFLDSQITSLDLYYLEDEELARQLVELGYRGSGSVLKREEFEARKAAAEAFRLSMRNQQRTLASAGKELKDNFLRALAEREEANRSGKMTMSSSTISSELVETSGTPIYCLEKTGQKWSSWKSCSQKAVPLTWKQACLDPDHCEHSIPWARAIPRKVVSIIFIRDQNSLGQEISGYIDYSHRLRSEDFEPYFSGKKRFLPKPTDLSFYNWKTQVSVSNTTANYQVIAENSTSLLFQNRRDRKMVNVDPKASPGDNSSRSPIQSDLYMHVVIFDHITRMKV